MKHVVRALLQDKKKHTQIRRGAATDEHAELEISFH
jgi:hypothetical protein